MKFYILFILQLSFVGFCFAQKSSGIDDIENKEDVEEFLIKNFEKEKVFVDFDTDYNVKYSQKIADSLNLKNWGKIDFDENGMTDLYVVRKYWNYSFFVVLAFENNRYKLVELTKDRDCLGSGNDFPIVIMQDNIPKVAMHTVDYCGYSPNEIISPSFVPKLSLDTLIVRNERFIESYVNNQKVEKIEIEYQSWGWHSKYSINKDGRIKFKRYYYKPLKHPFKIKFKTEKLSTSDYTEIWSLLEYIDWEKINSEYKLGCCEDASGVTLKVYYDGKVKEIKDYGLIGTYGLINIYKWTDEWLEH